MPTGASVLGRSAIDAHADPLPYRRTTRAIATIALEERGGDAEEARSLIRGGPSPGIVAAEERVRVSVDAEPRLVDALRGVVGIGVIIGGR